MKRLFFLALIFVALLFFSVTPVSAESEFDIYLSDFYQKAPLYLWDEDVIPCSEVAERIATLIKNENPARIIEFVVFKKIIKA